MKRDELLKNVVDVMEESANRNSLDRLISTCEESVLYLLEKAGGSTNPKYLSEKLDVTMPRVTMILNGMESKELVTREISAEDRRKVEVTITKKGRSVIRKRRKNLTEYVDRVTSDMDEAEIETVLKFIT